MSLSKLSHCMEEAQKDHDRNCDHHRDRCLVHDHKRTYTTGGRLIRRPNVFNNWIHRWIHRRLVGQRESREPRGKDKPYQVVQEIMTMTEGLICSNDSDDSGSYGRSHCSIHMSRSPLSTRLATRSLSR